MSNLSSWLIKTIIYEKFNNNSVPWNVFYDFQKFWIVLFGYTLFEAVIVTRYMHLLL